MRMKDLCGSRKNPRGRKCSWRSANAELPESTVKKGLSASPMFPTSSHGICEPGARAIVHSLWLWRGRLALCHLVPKWVNVSRLLGKTPGGGDFGVGQRNPFLVFRDPAP